MCTLAGESTGTRGRGCWSLLLQCLGLGAQAGWCGSRQTKWPPSREGAGWAAGSWPPPQPALRKSHSPEMSSRMTFPLALCQGTSGESRPPPFLSQCSGSSHCWRPGGTKGSLAGDFPSLDPHSTCCLPPGDPERSSWTALF